MDDAMEEHNVASSFLSEDDSSTMDDTLATSQNDLELDADVQVEEVNEGLEDESISGGDRSFMDLDIEVDGYKALSVGDLKPWKTELVAETMFDIHNDKSDKLLRRVPYQIQKNAAFMVNLAALKSDSDILADSNGRWTLQRGRRETNFFFDSDIKRMFQTTEEEGNKFIRTCYQNASVPDFKRVLILCKDLRMAFVQYYFKEGPEKSFKVAPHGNSKKEAGHDRLRDSTRQRIEELAGQGKKPREIHEEILKETGGPSHVETTAAIPSMKAIYNIVANSKPSGFDDFHVLILRCIKENGSSSEFVRQISVAPSFMVMLANDRQLNDLVRFSSVSGFALDTTFNIGDYLVTVVICRHLLLRRKSTEVNPVIIGPIFLHKFKNAESYRWMAAQLLHARPELRLAKLFGSDGDPALHSSFQLLFPNAKHLLCMIHFTDNMLRKLAELGMSGHGRVIMDEILGRREGTQRTSRYIDCRNAEEYEMAEKEFGEMVTNLHPNGHLLADFFRIHKAPQLKEHYSVDAQEAAGLRGSLYNTNAVESINALIKKDIHRKRTPLEFAEDVEALVEKQKVDFEFAVIGKGELELVPQYKHLELSFRRHNMMTSEQKAVAIKKIHSEPFDPKKEVPEAILLDDSHEMLIQVCLCKNDHGKKLSRIESVNQDVLWGMLQAAEKLLQIENPVSAAPGPNRTRFLVAGHKSLTEVIINEKSTEVKCIRDCHPFVMYGFCPDVIAAGIFLNQLDVVVDWANSDKVRKSNKFGLYKVMKANAPAKAGSKPQGTAVRKGFATRRPAVTEVVPSQNWSQASGSGEKRPLENSQDLAAASGTNMQTSIVTYSPALHKHVLWEKVRLQQLGTKPQPNIGEYEIWFLDQCDARTTKCSGCGRPFRKHKEMMPLPPNDIVLVTCGKRKFFKKGEQELLVSKSGNIYFHPQKVCLDDGHKKMEVTPASASEFVTSAAVKARMTVQHESRLWAAVF